MRILRLDCPGVKAALRHELLRGRSFAGRGAYSMVFDAGRPDRVLKLTVDGCSYWMLNDCYYKVEHQHFPRVAVNHGDIGEVRINGKDFPLFLYEMERLEPVKQHDGARKLARKIIKTGQKWSHKGCYSGSTDKSDYILGGLEEDPELPPGVRKAFGELREFRKNYDRGFLDLHTNNFMARKSGELVINDPIGDHDIWNSSQAQLRQRGY